jgi:hypothetical protein
MSSAARERWFVAHTLLDDVTDAHRVAILLNVLGSKIRVWLDGGLIEAA